MKPSDWFIEMAADIDRNEGKFGGAFMIVPPRLGGEPVGRLVVSKVDDAASAVHFLTLIQTELQSMIQNIQDKERNAFGRR